MGIDHAIRGALVWRVLWLRAPILVQSPEGAVPSFSLVLRGKVCVCVCVCEREREREGECVYERDSERVRV